MKPTWSKTYINSEMGYWADYSKMEIRFFEFGKSIMEQLPKCATTIGTIQHEDFLKKFVDQFNANHPPSPLPFGTEEEKVTFDPLTPQSHAVYDPLVEEASEWLYENGIELRTDEWMHMNHPSNQAVIAKWIRGELIAVIVDRPEINATTGKPTRKTLRFSYPDLVYPKPS